MTGFAQGIGEGTQKAQKVATKPKNSFFLLPFESFLCLLWFGLACPIFMLAQSPSDVQVSARAKQIHERAIVIDTHDDTPQRLLFDKNFNIGTRNKDGHVDIPRMREGGLDALFFSIWVPSDVTGPPAVKRALDQIDAVREAARTMPNDLVLATTAADVRKAAADHKIAALMGMEGGHMIDDDLRLLRVFAALGVRYMTLAASWGGAVVGAVVSRARASATQAVRQVFARKPDWRIRTKPRRRVGP